MYIAYGIYIRNTEIHDKAWTQVACLAQLVVLVTLELWGPEFELHFADSIYLKKEKKKKKSLDQEVKCKQQQQQKGPETKALYTWDAPIFAIKQPFSCIIGICQQEP